TGMVVGRTSRKRSRDRRAPDGRGRSAGPRERRRSPRLMDWSFLNFAYEPGLRPDSGGFRKLWEVAWALQTLGHTTRVFYPRLPGWVPLRDVPSAAYPVVDRAVVRPLVAHVSIALGSFRAARPTRTVLVSIRTRLH